MKFSEHWLREWVDPPVPTETLVQQLTMAGLEVDQIERAAPVFTDVVVGEVLAVDAHPNADKLTVCRVSAGDGEQAVEVVCGAPNVHVGMKTPLAKVNAVLPGGLRIRPAELRGVQSHGMLCSAKELGVSDDAAGLLELPSDVPVGADLRDLLDLDDTIIDIDLTPNRGDCWGLVGIAREVATANDQSFTAPVIEPVAAVITDTFPVRLEALADCPVFAGRVIRGLRLDAQTPLWMQERLRRSSIRPIHPVVDVTNYVMLELGQPMHGYDLRNLKDGIGVRRAKAGETLTLLDGRNVDLDEEVLVIADTSGAIGIAGVMGGAGTGVESDTTDVFLESAYFAPLSVAGRARRFGMHTDASTRFERGVDPTGQARAIEHATALLIDIAGGEPGPTSVVQDAAYLPKRDAVALRRERVRRVIGIDVPDQEIEHTLTLLGMRVENTSDGWKVSPPSFRFDIEIEEDLVEEIARVHGYDRIPEIPESIALDLPPDTETRVTPERVVDLLVDRGYQEAITYSFIKPALQSLFSGGQHGLRLSNPISEDLAEMRLSLWPGLIEALSQNLARQQERVRLFEYGMRFIPQGNEIKQDNVVAGVASGNLVQRQWGHAQTPTDFHDVKGDVEAILRLTGRAEHFEFEAAKHPALQPGQSAQIVHDGQPAGWIGMLHPAVLKALDIEQSVAVFELNGDMVLVARAPVAETVSRFPEVHRDIAVIVDEDVEGKQLIDCVRGVDTPLLRDVQIFDVYRGHNIDLGRKSVALGLILGDFSRTLTDSDADQVIAAMVSRLQEKLNAKIRD